MLTLLAHRLHVIANHADDAGGIDKRRLRMVCVDQFAERGVQLLFAAVHHVQLLHIGREAQPVQLRPRRQRAPYVPGVGGAADRPMHNVQGVGDGIQYDARAAEDAGALAHRTSHALLLAVELEGLLPDPSGTPAARAPVKYPPSPFPVLSAILRVLPRPYGNRPLKLHLSSKLSSGASRSWRSINTPRIFSSSRIAPL